MTRREPRRSSSSWNGKLLRRPKQLRPTTSARALRPSARSAKRGSPGVEEAQDLAILRPASLTLLREHQLAVGEDVVLGLRALPGRRVDPVLLQLGRETRGPSVVAASDGAVEDLDGHAEIVRTRVVPALQTVVDSARR